MEIKGNTIKTKGKKQEYSPNGKMTGDSSNDQQLAASQYVFASFCK